MQYLTVVWHPRPCSVNDISDTVVPEMIRTVHDLPVAEQFYASLRTQLPLAACTQTAIICKPCSLKTSVTAYDCGTLRLADTVR